MSVTPPFATPANRLRELLARKKMLVTPSCFDALSAKLIEQAGFDVAFMSGFAVSGARLGLPDTGLISYAEMAEQGRNICNAVRLPIIGDGDTGYGNAMNVKRTVEGYARAGFACVMIEDQLAPKRCGHTRGKAIVSRDEAFDRIKAAVDMRQEMLERTGSDILIMARTDARHEHGLAEALARAERFRDIGADILFVEAPKTEAEMREICRTIPSPQMANMVEGGETPVLPQDVLADIGYMVALYPLTLMSSAMKAMSEALARLRTDASRDDLLLSFAEVRKRVGFDDYYAEEQRYASARRD
jgi:2-methylisocitrate lyase-like PEP mutase family enzyme